MGTICSRVKDPLGAIVALLQQDFVIAHPVPEGFSGRRRDG